MGLGLLKVCYQTMPLSGANPQCFAFAAEAKGRKFAGTRGYWDGGKVAFSGRNLRIRRGPSRGENGGGEIEGGPYPVALACRFPSRLLSLSVSDV